ncbi:hypothetical protein UY416_03170 [Paenibacillus polymyxa]|uniref:hypothetical protein n=1 Tax=Paenibacillus polymyxa TaxID=1406 RepID=UPI002AB4EB54|nr:hypothetical protein [Paenibacillus polymyxa]MDY8045291.1 hypothetical protein [Paenibacillus polymyxa]
MANKINLYVDDLRDCPVAPILTVTGFFCIQMSQRLNVRNLSHSQYRLYIGLYLDIEKQMVKMSIWNNGDQSAGALGQRSMKDVAESIGENERTLWIVFHDVMMLYRYRKAAKILAKVNLQLKSTLDKILPGVILKIQQSQLCELE